MLRTAIKYLFIGGEFLTYCGCGKGTDDFMVAGLTIDPTGSPPSVVPLPRDNAW